MPETFVDLVRYSFFRPREAAKVITRLNYPRPVITQVVLLLAVLTVLLQYFLLGFYERQSPTPVTVTFPLPFWDIALQFGGAYLASYIVVFLARVARVNITLTASLITYAWVNFMMLILMSSALISYYVFTPVFLIILVFTLIWTPIALTVFWSELLGNKNLFLGFTIPVLAILLTSAISIILASALGLPLMEITTDV